jgi:hypothetical protein
VVDPVTQGIRRGAAVFGFLKAWNTNRKARRGERKGTPVGNEIVKSLVRHLGSGAAGAIVGTGVASADDSTIFVQVAIGLLVYGVTQGWSIVRKVRRAQTE